MVDNNIPETWLYLLGGRDTSGWLAAFVASPSKAVADLLWDAFYFGPLNLADRGQLLAGLLDVLNNSELFAERLDTALTGWVEMNWGRYDRQAESLASAWSSLSNVVEFSAKLHEDSELKRCAMALRERFDERDRFLGSFSTAPAADPLGAYLAVIAEFQGNDRWLAPFWHNMCDLPDGVPFYHARYALLGLRRLKAAEPSENGTLRAEVVLGLLRLARAFDRLARKRKLREDLAENTFRRIAMQTWAAYRDSPGWAKHGSEAALELSARAQQWLTKTVPPLGQTFRKAREHPITSRNRQRLSKVHEPDPNWVRRAGEIATRLRNGERGCLPDARRLLNEERRYAEATGESYHIVRTLRNFASRVLRFSPDLALQWANEARRWAPNDDYTWNTVRTVLLARPEWRAAALRFAWIAWKRFPSDVVAHTGLAEALRIDGRNREAEAIYRQTIERFPTNIVARSGLANILATMKRWGEAETEYRRNIELGLADSTTFSALAYLVHRKGETARAEALDLIRQALESDPANRFARALKQKLVTGAEVNLDEFVAAWDEVVNHEFTPTIVDELAPKPEGSPTSQKEQSAPVESRTSQERPPTAQPVGELGDVKPKTDQIDLQAESTEELAEPSSQPEPTKRLRTKIEPAGKPPESRSPTETDAKAEHKITLGKAHLNARISKGVEEGRDETTKPNGPRGLTPDLQDTPSTAWQAEPALTDQSEVGQIEPKSEQKGDLEIEAMASRMKSGKTRTHEGSIENITDSNNLLIAALVAEAYFYRTWARGADHRVATARRDRAGELLFQAEQLSPQDAQVLAEKATLFVDQGMKTVAYESLSTELGSHPGVVSLLVLKARMDRERAREQSRRLDRSTLAELCRFPQKLRELESAAALAPLFHYQRGLAALALLDGNERRQIAADSFSSFRRRLSYLAAAERADRQVSLNPHERETPGFHEWIQTRVNRGLFAELDEPEDVQATDISLLDLSWNERQFAIEEVEDVFADRVAFGTV